MRPRSGSIAANPILIGAATVLIAVVAVFLAYNANNGLPFVPTYDLRVEVPNATALVKGNEVRIAGSRIGVISAIEPRQDARNGRVFAVLDVHLEKRVEPLPADSTVIVRSRSSLGLKYLQITEGTSAHGIPDGGTVALRQARPEPVEIDEVFNTFDAPTRTASAGNLTTFASAFAGRGRDLNTAFATFPHLLTVLEPVMKQLAAPRTGLANLFRSLGQAAAAVAPVAEQQAGWFAGMDETFSALAGVAPSLEESIAEGPESLRVATDSFRHQAPFVEKSTRFLTELTPAVDALATAAPSLGAVTSSGVATLTNAVGLNDRLDAVLAALGAFGGDTKALTGIAQTSGAVAALKPTVDTLAPMQSVCNYPGTFLRNIASTLNDGDTVGTWLRFGAILMPTGPNSEGGPASQPADGPTLENHLHSTAYPNVAAPGQPKVCEAGNQFYTPGLTDLKNAAPAKSLTVHEAPENTRLLGAGAPKPPKPGATR
jgi:ABC-type transporter Mla subunit MlaD